MYKAICGHCGAILESSNVKFTLDVRPHSRNIITCWFCGCYHITDDNVKYEHEEQI